MNWEYNTIQLDGAINIGEWNKELNTLGKEGWELVNIIPQIDSSSDYATGDIDLDITCCESVYVATNIAVFKRKLDSNQSE